MKKTAKALVALGAVASLTLATTACSDSSSDSTDTTEATTAEYTIEGQWARTSPTAADTGAAYMTITSSVDDALVDVSVDASVAKMAQIHEMVMASDSSDMSSDTTMGDSDMGEMVMQEVDEIELPAGKAVALKPGGYHIMMMELVTPLKAGTSIVVTLTFKSGATKTVTVPVMDEAPSM